MTATKRIRPVLGLPLAAALIALTACGGGGSDTADSAKDGDGAESADSSEESAPEESSSAAAEGPQPDLDSIPDVVAEVNGEEVTKDEFVVLYEVQFQQAASQAQAGGEAPDEDTLKKQTADTLVDTELLSQEAEARGISVGDDDVEAELTALAEQNQMASADELLAALEKQGTTEDQARSQIESQVEIEQLVTDEAGAFEPTDADLRKIYDQAKKQQAAAGEQAQPLPPFAKVKPQIVEQAESDQINKVASTLVADLREDADITINL